MRNIIVIGASAGGIAAINTVISGISPTINAAILIVTHLSRKSNAENIANILQRHTSLPCHVAVNNTVIVPGNIYLAPQDHHLMVSDGMIRTNQGAHENKYRPSIDVLFRSVAVNYGNSAIGVILTGMLEDGTSGMWAIKNCGGICIVQDPLDAEFPDMPRSVLNKITVDYNVEVSKIPAVLEEILNKPLPEYKPIPNELRIEANITQKMMSHINDLKSIADHSDFICPDCGGGLWAVKNDPMHRYRCHTGHVYNEKVLNEIQDEKIEESIWVSVRMLEEKLNLLKLMEKRDSEESSGNRSVYYQKREQDISIHIERLKKLLVTLHKDLNDPDLD
jgi:two-component system chemotaxis response regulator CheB